MYGVDLSVQLTNLMPAFGAGFLMAFVYDVVCFLRLCVFRGKIFLFITDMVYCIFCTVFSFLLVLSVNYGQFRFYLLLAQILACVVYRLTLGKLIMIIIRRFSSVLNAVFKKMSLPFISVGKMFVNFLKKLKKVKKKPCNISDECSIIKDD